MNAELASDRAVQVVDSVRQAVVQGAPITPSIERQVQDALAALRLLADRENIRRAERVSITLFTLLQAKRHGRPNLYASQLLKLARV